MSDRQEYPATPGQTSMAGMTAVHPQPWDLRTHGSGLVEKVLEYGFLHAVTAGLLCRGERFEVLRGDCDLDGHDLVIEAGGVLRHIQLKGMTLGGRSRRVPVNTRLAAKPSGCVVWMSYDPASLAITRWRWFGAAPGQPLGDLGDRMARHSRGNSAGLKAGRPHIRILPAGLFEELPGITALVDRLFGPAAEGADRLQPALLPRSVPDLSSPQLAGEVMA